MITVLFNVAIWAVNVYKWVVIIAAIISTLTSFGVLDTRNRIVWTITDFFYRITEPALRPIRNMLPSFGGIDLSPWVLVVLLIVVEEVLVRLEQAVIFGTSLHVSGDDAAALETAIGPFRTGAYRWEKIPSGLEDVFIHLMDQAKDNFSS